MKKTKRIIQLENKYALQYSKSDEKGAGWFMYTTSDTPEGWVLSSCETLEDIDRMDKANTLIASEAAHAH